MPQSPLSRRHWLYLGATVVAGASLARPVASAPALRRSATPIRCRQRLVREFVGKAHTDLGATKTLLAEHPSLLNATWDWGGGDFETGLGGASHMGSRDDRRVPDRPGRADGPVRRRDAWSARHRHAHPHGLSALVQSRGPHGLTLLHHAREGGEPARDVLAYLERLGAS